MDIIPCLYNAAEQKNWKLVRKLLRNTISTENYRDICDELLHFATFVGDKETVTLLLNENININHANHYGMTALHFSVSPCSEEMIKFLPNKSKCEIDLDGLDPRTDNFLMERFHYKSSTKREALHALAECCYLGLTYYYVRQNSPVKSNSELVPSCKTSHKPCIETRDLLRSNVETIEMLLKSSANVNACFYDNKRPLHCAAEYGHVDNINTLLQYKPDINCHCKVDGVTRCTPLHLSVKKPNEQIIEILINFGAEVDANDANDRTPLHWAVEYGFIANVKTLLKYKADVNYPCVMEKETGCTTIHFAAISPSKDILQVLLDSGANIKATTEHGNTPLQMAVRFGRICNVKILLNKGSDVNFACPRGKYEGYTALHFAAEKSNPDIVDLLLSSGASVNAVTKYDKTPLMLAVENQQIFNVINLLKYQPNVNATCIEENCEGYTALHFAAKGNVDIVEILVNSGSCVNSRTVYGITPIHLAVKFGHEKIVRDLLAYKSDVNIRCTGLYAGYTPLHFGVIQPNTDIVKMLLNCKNLVDAVTDNGKTPLHLAVEYSHIENVKVLLSNKASVHALSASGDEEGYTRFVFDEDSSNNVIKKLLNSENEYYLHFFTEEISDSNNFQIVMKYKPVVNCSCSTKVLPPIHFAVKGCVDRITVYLRQKKSKPLQELNTFHPYPDCCEDGRIIQSSISKYVPDCNCMCDSKYIENYTPLHFASKGTNHEITEILLNYGSNINAYTSNGETALYLAVMHNQVKNIDLILKYLIDVNISCKLGCNSGYTALHCAAARPDKEIVTKLLNKGALLNISTSNGETPLFIAVKMNRIDNIKVFLKRNINVNNHDNKNAFFYSVINSKPKISDMLNKCGFSVESNDINNIEVLHHSIIKKYINIFDEFLRLGVDVNSVTNNKDSLLHIACKYNNKQVVQKLLKHNVNFNCFDSRGDTVLHILTSNQNNNFIIEILEQGIDVNIKNCINGNTALNLACDNYDHQKVETENCILILLKYKADINYSPSWKMNPLCSLTSKKNSYHLIKLFLDHGADLNKKDITTALHTACYKVDNEDTQPEKYINLFLKYGADVHNLDSSSNTPLHIACQNYLHPTIISHTIDNRITALVLHGSDLKACNYYNQTPFQIYFQTYEYFRRGCRKIPNKFINTTLFLIEQLVVKNQTETASFLIEQVFRKNYLFSEEVRPLCHKLENHLSKCEEEINKLKKEVYGSEFLFDILTGDIKMLSKNLTRIKAISYSDIQVRYPVYSDYIIDNLNQGTERNKVMRFIGAYLNCLFNSKLPDRAVKIIIDNLDERDFKIFNIIMSE